MQIISGFFGVLAYFLSMVFGNELLLYIAAVVVFITAVFPVLFIQEDKELAIPKVDAEVKFGIAQVMQEIFPLYGFLVFGLFSLFYHFFPEALGALHNPILIGALLYSVVIGVVIILKGRKGLSNRNEFQKIMLAAIVTGKQIGRAHV